MAKVYKAVTRIKHGKEGGEVVEFAPGDRVTGLTKEEMKSLWDAGALEQAEVEVTPAKPAEEATTPEEPKAPEGTAGGDV
jgi:uncharacterized Zn finger protein